MNTTIKRNHEGKLVAETRIELGFDRRELRIDTQKNHNHYGGGVKTGATVVQVSEDGMSYTHVFGLAGDGDWSRTLIHDKTARGTEKTITAQHSTALIDLEAIKAAAVAHYRN